MTPPKDAFPDKEISEEQEERKWNAFWHTIPGWVKTPAAVILAATASHLYTKWQVSQADPMTSKPAEPSVYWDEGDLRKMIRSELQPLNAGFKAFVDTQPTKTQLAVLQAMDRARATQEAK